MSEQKNELRSRAWFGATGRSGMVYRSWMRNQGFGPEVFDGRPVIGIANTWSELAPCNAHLDRVAEAVKRGVWQAGGFPLVFPVAAAGETLMRPTAMFYRNLLAMDGRGDDPGQPAGRRGTALRVRQDHAGTADGRGQRRPPGHHGHRRADAERQVPRAATSAPAPTCGSSRPRPQGRQDDAGGVLRRRGLHGAVQRPLHDDGHRVDDGVRGRGARHAASGLGDLARGRLASLRDRAGGRPARSSAMVEEDLRPSQILTREAFENAIRANAAIGGSTNAIMHLLALAGRLGVQLDLDDFDALARAGADARQSDAVRPVPHGGLLLRGRPARGAEGARRRRSAQQRAAHRHRPRHRRQQRRRRVLEPRGDLQPRRAVPTAQHGHRRPARQPRAGRCGHQAVGRVAATAQARGTRTGLRLTRGLPRRLRRPRHGRRGVGRADHQVRRAQGLSRYARGRQRAAAHQAAARPGSPTWCGSATAA